MKILATCLSLISLAHAASRKTAPPGALTVGAGQKFATISSAVAALSNTTASEQVIFIHPGIYTEQVYIPKLSGPLTVLGYTRDDTKYSKNEVTIVASRSQKTKPNNDLTATLRVWTSDFKLYNVNVKNAFGPGSQAVAVSAQAGHQGYYACSFIGYQDTLLAQSGAQLYAETYIEGATDFIFGQRAQAWFEKCDIGVVPFLEPNVTAGWVTASGRSSNDSGWYIINESRVEAAQGSEVADGAYYLGRPWRSWARAVFQSSRLGRVVDSRGWAVRNVGDERLDDVTFAEYGNKGPGAKGERASFDERLESPVAIETVLGDGWAGARYVDARFLKQ